MIDGVKFVGDDKDIPALLKAEVTSLHGYLEGIISRAPHKPFIGMHRDFRPTMPRRESFPGLYELGMLVRAATLPTWRELQSAVRRQGSTVQSNQVQQYFTARLSAGKIPVVGDVKTATVATSGATIAEDFFGEPMPLGA